MPGRRRILLLALTLATSLAAALPACSAKGSGHRRAEARTVDPFTEVQVSGITTLELDPAPTPALVVEADDNLLPKILSSVAAGRLTISSTGMMVSSAGPVARASAPALSRVIGEGSGKIHLRGASVPRLEVELTGARDATLEGAVDELVLRLSGATKVDARKLAAKAVSVDASGSASIELGAPATLTASASGAARVRFDGAPAVTRTVTGSASVERR